MSMTLNFLGGAPFQLLYDGVKLAMSNASKFKTHLRSLKFTLDCLQPQIIEQIRLQNLQLNIPVQEIQELQRKIDEGIVLVGRLSSINTYNIRVWGSCCSCLMVSYADQLDELNESLRRLFEILRLQSLAQINQTAILARTTRDRQDELERKQLRIIDMLMKQQQILERIEENTVAASTGTERAAPVPVLRLGAVFQALFDAVVQVKVKNSRFKRLLEDFKFTLECLKPLVQEIVECNKVLHFPKEKILEDFIEYLEKGVEVVYKCSKSSMWYRFKKYECISSVFELDESLQRLFNILRLQIENDVKEALVSVSKLEKEIEEIEGSFLLQHHQYESAAAETQLPKIEVEVMNMQVTRDVESMDSTGNVEVGDESHMRTEGSSLASHQIDVAVEEEREPLSPTIGRIEERFDSAPPGSNMEVGEERTVGQGEEDREIWLVACKEAEKEATTPIVPVLAAHKRHASVETVVKNYEEHFAARRIQVAFRRYLGRKRMRTLEVLTNAIQTNYQYTTQFSSYEALVSVSKLEKEIDEIEGSFALQSHQYERAAAELQLPKVESDVVNVQDKRDVKQSLDSTRNVEVGDGSRKQFGGSSQALQRIDVAVEEPPSPTTALDVMSIPEELPSARNSMEVRLEETGGKGKSERETRLVPCKAVEQETLAPIDPVLASQKRNASLVTVLLSYAGISENQSSTVSRTSSSSQYSHFTEATTSSPRHDDDQESTDGEILETSNLKIFSCADLKFATKNFSSDRILGEGGFGRVFKGWVDEKTLQPCKAGPAGTGMMVAVKKLSPESLQGFQEWQSEVNFLGRLSHPNLVKLLGYCCEDKDLLLVYEFMQKGSLENHLFRRSTNNEPLSWDIRIRIAIGAARGLAFLHSSENPIIHRNPKPSNILLDRNCNAKISDFGLAKLGPTGGDSHVSTRVMGTSGYAAPEYIATGHLYVKSDVYVFGVVLLEILTGLRVFDTKRPKEQINLVDWAKPLLPHRRKLKTIMDARMEGQYSFKAALQTANITLKCLASDPRRRPSMKEVLEELEQVQAIREKPKPALLDISRLHISSPR